MSDGAAAVGEDAVGIKTPDAGGAVGTVAEVRGAVAPTNV